MQELVANCPRCGAKQHTFVVKALLPTIITYGWKSHLEAYCVCKHCIRGTIFEVSQKDIKDRDKFRSIEELEKYKLSLNTIVDVDGFISTRNIGAMPAPLYTPSNIKSAFDEGAQSVIGGCPNAAGAMFRLCIDLATKELLPVEDVDALDKNAREKLKRRLEWLFRTKRLDNSLEELSHCIREDGNDGAHDGTLTKVDAEDLQEFTVLLLEKLYTVPGKLKDANERRANRGSK